MKDMMIEFMKARELCVISTVDPEAKPESAMVAYVNNGLDIFIGTSNKSRKFANLTRNPSVAIVIADTTGEVQFEGQARAIGNDSSLETIGLPGFAHYRNDPDQVYIHVKPTWVRFTTHGKHGIADKIEEWSDF